MSRVWAVAQACVAASCSCPARPGAPAAAPAHELAFASEMHDMMGWITGTTRQTRVHGRLTRIQDDLRRVRATERVLAEQAAYLDEVADDAETRKLVAQTPLADREWQEARTDADRHRALLDDARREADRLLAERDQLLDRLHELESGSRRRDDT